MISGTVLDKRGGANPSFVLRTMKLDVPIELQMPIYSPFIVSIRLLAKGHYRRAKLYYLRDRPYREWVAE
jgi:large subunit ribosomal protein L19